MDFDESPEEAAFRKEARSWLETYAGSDEARDVGRPETLQRELESDPSWQAETARVASDFQRLDSTGGGSIASVEATEAETPAENLRHISDPSPTPKAAS